MQRRPPCSYLGRTFFGRQSEMGTVSFCKTNPFGCFLVWLSNVSNHGSRLAKKFAETPTLLEGFSDVKARFERIPVAALRARARRTAVHAAAVFSMHDGGPTPANLLSLCTASGSTVPSSNGARRKHDSLTRDQPSSRGPLRVAVRESHHEIGAPGGPISTL